MCPFSWQYQNLCLLSLAFIIDWRVVPKFASVDLYFTHSFTYPDSKGLTFPISVLRLFQVQVLAFRFRDMESAEELRFSFLCSVYPFCGYLPNLGYSSKSFEESFITAFIYLHECSFACSRPEYKNHTGILRQKLASHPLAYYHASFKPFTIIDGTMGRRPI